MTLNEVWKTLIFSCLEAGTTTTKIFHTPSSSKKPGEKRAGKKQVKSISRKFKYVLSDKKKMHLIITITECGMVETLEDYSALSST